MKILILDSNSLFTPHERRLIGPETENELRECRKLYEIKVIVPRVVLAEVAYKKVGRIVKDYIAAIASLASTARIINAKPPEAPITAEALKIKLYRLFLQWCKENEIQVEPLRPNNVQWKQVVTDAVLRRPPFSPGESEKGFRDALILEIISGAAKRYPGAEITFVSKDKLLLSAAAKKFSDVTVSLVDTVAAYRSQLLLEFEHVVAKRFATLTVDAAARFYTPNEPSSVFLKANVISALQEKHREEIEKVPNLSAIDRLVFFPDDVDLKRLQVIGETYGIGPTLYRGSRGGQKHQWNTRVVIATVFETEPRFPGMAPKEFVKEVKFDVTWSANVSEDGQYSDETVTDIVYFDSSLTIMSDRTREAYSLPRPWERRIGKAPPPITNILLENPWNSGLLRES